jgi:GT2 family glycosyltransferase
MKILGHIHSFNDEEVIDRSLGALMDQTHPVAEILLVDNGSTDRTLQRSFPHKVTVIRHQENLGTSGAVLTGFEYAWAKQFDWIWILDADSAPRREALEKLVDLYRSFPPAQQAQVWLLGSLPIDESTHQPYHAITLTAQGPKMVERDLMQVVYACDATMWSGSLYKMAAAHQIGFPSADYVLDWGEYEYGYRGKRCGFKAFMHQDSIIDHNIGGHPGPGFTVGHYRFGPVRFKLVELPPIRWYYVIRNSIYFWFYVYHQRALSRYVRDSARVGKHLVKLLLLSRWPSTRACLRGLFDGIFKRMHCRYLQ